MCSVSAVATRSFGGTDTASMGADERLDSFTTSLEDEEEHWQPANRGRRGYRAATEHT